MLTRTVKWNLFTGPMSLINAFFASWTLMSKRLLVLFRLTMENKTIKSNNKIVSYLGGERMKSHRVCYQCKLFSFPLVIGVKNQFQIDLEPDFT